MNNERKAMNSDDASKNKDLILKAADKYAHDVYRLTKQLSKDELFGITSQLRRASLSVALNIVEGHARGTEKNRINFSRIAYGSLKESQYLLDFCEKEWLFPSDQTANAFALGDKLARMLWKKIRTMESRL